MSEAEDAKCEKCGSTDFEGLANTSFIVENFKGRLIVTNEVAYISRPVRVVCLKCGSAAPDRSAEE